MSKEAIKEPKDVFNFNYQQNLPYFMGNFSEAGNPSIKFKFPKFVIVDVDPFDVFQSLYKAEGLMKKNPGLSKIKKIMRTELVPGDVYSFSVTMNENLRKKLGVQVLNPILLQEYSQWFIHTKNHGQEIKPFDVYTLAQYFCSLMDLPS